MPPDAIHLDPSQVYVSLAVIGVVLTAVLTAAWKVLVCALAIRDQLKSIERKLDGGWTIDDQREFVDRLNALSAPIVVPTVAEIVRSRPPR